MRRRFCFGLGLFDQNVQRENFPAPICSTFSQKCFHLEMLRVFAAILLEFSILDDIIKCTQNFTIVSFNSITHSVYYCF